jgi:chemosensory pili system protein ChpA (sensor histidine kinase/response regulator)
MTTPFSALPDAGQGSFDTGPLSWVIGEIREALARSKTALFDAVGKDQEAQQTLLHHAKTYLHQAHGALQIVDVDGVSIISETVEDLLDRLKAGQLAFTLENAAAIERAYQAVVEYLEELLSGVQPQPVRLFPYYQALLQVRGADRIHPADLFFPNLAIRPQLPPFAVANDKVDYTNLRQRFERALLPFLKSAEREKAAPLVEVIASVERAQSNAQSLAFWWVMHGFAEAVAQGQVPGELYVKQLFGRINLQIRRLAEGSSSISERLLRDALFFIARAQDPAPRARQIRSVYQLDGSVPDDYEKRRYGQVDVDALALAKERLAKAKNIWSRIADDDANLWALFEQEMGVLTDASGKLNAPSLSKLLRELNGIARHAANTKLDSALSLEIARSLLFVENALDNISRLPDDFSSRADALTARLLALVSGETQLASTEWMDELSRQAQQRQTVTVLSNEMKANLRQVEKVLDEYFLDPGKHAALHNIAPVLHQIQGALAVLDQDDAVRAVQHTQAAVQGLITPKEGAVKDVVAERETLQAVAQNVGALGFFIEMLAQNFDLAKKRFHFDDAHGIFRANPVDRTTGAHAPINVEVSPLDGEGHVMPGAPAAPMESAAAVIAPLTVEAELLLHQEQTAEFALAFAADPNNPALQQQLRDSLIQVRKDAALLDNQDVIKRAQAALDLLDNPDLVVSDNAMSGMIHQAEPAPMAITVAAVTPETDDEIDAELLEIFMSEADEVLAFVQKTVPESRQSPHNQDALTTVRRSFHTLKGSGRMVGLNVFAEAASSIEQVMNLWLSEARAGTNDLYALLDYAASELTAWVEDIKVHGKSGRTATALVNAAERVKMGGGFMLDAEPVAAALAMVDVVEMAAVTEPEPMPEPEPEPVPEPMPEPAPTPVIEPAPAPEPISEPAPEPVLELVSEPELLMEPVMEPVSAQMVEPMPEAPLADAIAAAESFPALTAELDMDAVDAPAVESVPALTPEAALQLLLDQASEIEALALPEAGQPMADAEQDAEAALHAALLAPEPVLVGEVHDLEHNAESETDANVDGVADSADSLDSAAGVDRVPVEKRDDNIKYIGPLQISVPLYNIYLVETDGIVRLLAQDFAEWRHEPHRAVTTEAVYAAHSLGGSSATVGFKALQEVAHALEMVLGTLERRPVSLSPSDYDTLEYCVSRLKLMLQSFALGEMPEPASELVLALEYLQEHLELRPEIKPLAPESAFTPSQDELDAGFDAAEDALDFATVETPMAALVESAVPIEAAAAPDTAEDQSAPDVEFDVDAEEVLTATVAQAAGTSETLEISDATQAHDAGGTDVIAEAVELPYEAMFDAVSGSDMGAVDDVIIAESAESAEPAEPENDSAGAAAAESIVIEAPANEDAPIETAALDETPLEPAVSLAPMPVAPAPPVQMPAPAVSEDAIVLESASILNDELDADLLPVFLEEGRDLLPQVGQALRSWQQNPADPAYAQALLRLLHTVKGSARMAGAMRLGQHAHEIETRIENIMHLGPISAQSFEELLAHYDHSVHLFDQLQNPSAAVAPLVLPVDEGAPAAAHDAGAVPIRPSPALKTTATAAVPLVRVRADILDRLVNQAGEVSIARSKLENEVGLLRQSLSELTENITRLRGQLREVEIQAESQITSRMAHSNDREFDPLEFDRFSRLQELTRMMAESVNDVASVQEGLARTVDGATTDLAVQARLTRDLQQDLMRVRMVPFSSISERLYRVTRQASKELDKRVNLDIRGTAVEIDRSVLEKMTAPFEHLLRNAIVHGIESRAARRAAGKSEIGELRVEISQEGNEVVIHFKDDGAGLNLDRIRAKARETGLLAEGAEVTDAEAADMIFESGFSTSAELTELAGRGVGMDVVRSEAAGLGGRVEIASEMGKGAHFTIHLPLTLAVTQVVLLSTGGKTYAVPSVLVEQVQQFKSVPLETAYQEGSVTWQGNRVPMHYLSALLGDSRATPVAQRYSPILILKSGSDRVAIHVDEVLGNKEVVVKNIGPQLARMIGIAGATVLGSGDIVLILNPVPLAQRAMHESLRALRPIEAEAVVPDAASASASASTGVSTLAADVAPAQSDIAPLAAATLAAPAAPVVADTAQATPGMRKMSIVMVVDDSLTVRKVTQRFLVREGYQVVLAKDGVDALEQLQTFTPDVMLVDIEMPRMDGFDLTRNVRGDERTSNTPIIMITSRTADKHRNYAMELGVNAYFGKPFQEDKLLEAIAGFVKRETPVE